MKPSARRVLLLIETSKIYGRMLLKGIGRYALTHGRWSMCVDERGLFDRQPDWLRHWRGDGVIFRSNGRAMVDAICATGLPAVDTNSAVVDHGFPLAYPDERAVARVAVAHFAERGFRHFAFCSMERARWVQWRHRAYVEHVRGLAHECHCHDAPIRRHQGSWDQQLRQLARWVAELPKPVAVLAANDICGMRLIDACRLAGEAVPEQVAVLGVDNDEILCTLTTPPLSSIDLNAEQIGYEAATRLDRMMRGEVALPPLNLVVPNGVVQRQSTNALAIEDEQLVAALEFIREHACEGISVTDVVKPAAAVAPRSGTAFCGNAQPHTEARDHADKDRTGKAATPRDRSSRHADRRPDGLLVVQLLLHGIPTRGWDVAAGVPPAARKIS